MSQDAQRRPWWERWKDNWPILALVALMLVIATITGLGYWQRWAWTGLVTSQDNPVTRPVWDWLELLIIPLVLGLGALWFNAQNRKPEEERARRDKENDRERAERDKERDRELAQDRAREEAL